MKNSVRIKAHNGQVVNQTSNPEYGYVRVEQVAQKFEGGWMRNIVKSALISGETEALKSVGFVDGQELPGKIVIKESFEAPNPNDAEQGLKIAGDTGIPCTNEGRKIYRQSFYTEDLEATDELIQHDNVDAIKAAMETQSQSEETEADQL